MTQAPNPLPTLVLPPGPSHTHTHTVVFLHGRGDNTHNFSRSLADWCDSNGRNLGDIFPSFRWVFPQAPLRPLASTGGRDIWRQWFDVWSVRDFADREEVQDDGLREMVPLVRDLLRDEAERLAGRWDRVVLAGISMGGATGVHVLCNLDVPASGGGRLAAFMGFCSRCPFAGRGLEGMRAALGLEEGVPEHDEVLRRTPVLLEHCADDPLVTVENGRRLRDTLRGFGAQVQWNEYPGGGHWLQQPDGLDDAVEFLERVVVGGHGSGAGEGIPGLQAAESGAMDLC